MKGKSATSNKAIEFLRGCETHLELDGEKLVGSASEICIARHHFHRQLLERNAEKNRFFTTVLDAAEAKNYGIRDLVDMYRQYEIDPASKEVLYSSNKNNYTTPGTYLQVPSASTSDIEGYVLSVSSERGKRKIHRAHTAGSTAAAKKARPLIAEENTPAPKLPPIGHAVVTPATATPGTVPADVSAKGVEAANGPMP